MGKDDSTSPQKDTAGAELTGACACGAVTVRARAPREYTVCHCQMCRRWVSGPMMAVACGPDFSYDGPVNIWQSSDWAERANCARCGSALFYHLKEPSNYIAALGLFDEQNGWTMTQEIFIDYKADHFAFANETKKMTEAEFMQMFSSN